MSNLVLLKNKDAFTTSLIIADGTGVKHRNVKELFSKYEAEMKSFGTFSVSNAQSTGGRPEEIYLLNEQQATFLITLFRNTQKVVAFKQELVRQFYEMRRLLLERQTKTWLETRHHGKITRHAETDVLKELIDYAKDQGSQNADMLYVNYTRLANKMAGISKRDLASVMQLNNLTTIENIILRCIQLGIAEDKHYKQIYKECKRRLEDYQEIAFLGPGREAV